MTYNVFGGTLSLTQSINQPLIKELAARKIAVNGERTVGPRPAGRHIPKMYIASAAKSQHNIS